jgi:hypothetical protein
MKKTFLALINVFLIFIVNLSAQVKPFTGYDKAAWGVSEQSVRQLYSIADDVTAQIDNNDSNITILKQNGVSDNIYKREFFFNSNKLYRVIIEYYSGNDAVFSQLKGLLEQRYGTSTGIDYQTGETGSLFFSVSHRDNIYIFGKFAPDIEVKLIQRKYYASFPPNIFIYYTWKKFHDEYQASKLGL